MAKSFLLFFIALFLIPFVATEHSHTPVAGDPSTWTLPQLKSYLDSFHIEYSSPPERADFVALVKENAAHQKESLAEWFTHNKDQAASTLESAHDVVASLIEKLRHDLKERKDLTEDEINHILKAVKTEATKVQDWADLKETQYDEAYTRIKNDLEKEGKLKKNDMDWFFGVLRADMESTAKDYSASAHLFATTASATGASAYHYMSSKVADAYSSAASVVGQAFHKVSSGASDEASSAANLVTSAAGEGASSASSAASSLRDTASDSISSAYSAATETASKTYGTTVENVESLLSAVHNHLISTKNWTQDQVDSVIIYLKDHLLLARLQTEQQINSFIAGMDLYLVEKKEATRDQIEDLSKSVKEQLENWRKSLPLTKQEL